MGKRDQYSRVARTYINITLGLSTRVGGSLSFLVELITGAFFRQGLKAVDRLTVRPEPRVGESLSGYLMRIAEPNGLAVRNLIDLCFRDSTNGRFKQIHLLDWYPNYHFDVERISELTNLPHNKIRAMTATSINDRLYQLENEQYFNFVVLIADCLVKTHRRFCPICLAEDGVYKLLWQVKELKECNRHHVQLAEFCGICGVPQPYISENLPLFKCSNCGSDLRSRCTGDNTRFTDDNSQDRKWEDWHYLMDESVPLYPNKEGLTPVQSLMLALLFVSQEASADDNIKNNKVLSKDALGTYRRVVVQGKRTSSIVRLDHYLHIIRESNLRVVEFANTSVPSEFYNNLFGSAAIEICTTPWCESRGSTESMLRVKPCPSTTYKGKKYRKHSVCTACWIDYGVEVTSLTWGPVGDTIEKIESVRRLMEQGYTLKVISAEIRVDYRVLLRFIGYLLNHDLLSSQVSKRYMSNRIEHINLTEAFKLLANSRGKMLSNAKRMFGWTPTEYFYYRSVPEVERYMKFEARRFQTAGAKQIVRESTQSNIVQKVREVLKYCLQENIDITSKGIINRLGCKYHALRREDIKTLVREARDYQAVERKKSKEIHLIDLARKLFEEHKKNGVPIRKSTIYDTLKIAPTRVSKQYPVLYQVISEYVEADKAMQRKSYMHQILNRGCAIIEDLYVSGELDINKVAVRLNLSVSTLQRYHPQLVMEVYKRRQGIRDSMITR